MLRDPDKLIELAESLHRPRELYLKWKQICDRFERGRHTIYGEFYGYQSKEEAVESRKAKAYSCDGYKEYLEKWDKAEKEKIKAQVKYENILTNFEAYQSALSFDKEMIKRNM